MKTINSCIACNNLINGVKTRIPVPHTCGKTYQQIADYVEKQKLKDFEPSNSLEHIMTNDVKQILEHQREQRKFNKR